MPRSVTVAGNVQLVVLLDLSDQNCSTQALAGAVITGLARLVWPASVELANAATGVVVFTPR